MFETSVDVLAIGPHPDDVELFCGGTVALLGRQGRSVGIVDMTRGEMATRGTPEIRAGEAEAAAEALGVQWRHNLGLPDAGLRPDADDDAVPRLVEVLRQARPQLVLYPPARCRHPDHEATHGLVRRAMFLAGLGRYGTAGPHRPNAHACYLMRVGRTANFVVDISDVYDVKRRAIDCYASQVAPRSDGTLVGAPGSREALEARDRVAGALIGASFGEPFVTDVTVGTTDPVSLLATPSGRPRLLMEDAE